MDCPLLLRRALAQSVSDAGPLEREPKQQNFNHCFNAFFFNLCFSFQQSTVFGNPFSFFARIQQSSKFFTLILSTDHFSARTSNSASTAAATTVSCLNSAHARLPLREPPGTRIGSCLSLAGYLFRAVSGKHFFTQKSDCRSNMTPRLTYF